MGALWSKHPEDEHQSEAALARSGANSAPAADDRGRTERVGLRQRAERRIDRGVGVRALRDECQRHQDRPQPRRSQTSCYGTPCRNHDVSRPPRRPPEEEPRPVRAGPFPFPSLRPTIGSGRRGTLRDRPDRRRPRFSRAGSPPAPSHARPPAPARARRAPSATRPASRPGSGRCPSGWAPPRPRPAAPRRAPPRAAPS
jgi:hypothetical protein